MVHKKKQIKKMSGHQLNLTFELENTVHYLSNV